MDNIYKLILVFLVIYSNASFAETYPRVTKYYGAPPGDTEFYSIDEFCSIYLTSGYYSAYPSLTTYTYNLSSSRCYYNSEPSGYYQIWQKHYYCPGGGTISGGNCINAPACSTGETRSTSGSTNGQCIANPSCTPPETYDTVFGACHVKECLSTQVLNPSTGACQTPPTCGSTEQYNSVTNLCELKQLKCPEHSHQSTQRDKCLPDAPLACPSGQHDDGTYNCVANDAQKCTSAQVSGSIYGIPQCINKTNAAQFAKDAADAEAMKNIKSQAEQSALAAKQAADAALAADPNNTTKQQEAATAASNYQNASDQLNAADKADNEAQDDHNERSLQNISDNLEYMQGQNNKDRADGYGTLPAETVGTNTVTVNSNISLPGPGSCPAPATISTHFGNVTIDYSSYCNFASQLKPLVLTFAWLSAAFIVVGGMKEE